MALFDSELSPLDKIVRGYSPREAYGPMRGYGYGYSDPRLSSDSEDRNTSDVLSRMPPEPYRYAVESDPAKWKSARDVFAHIDRNILGRYGPSLPEIVSAPLEAAHAIGSSPFAAPHVQDDGLTEWMLGHAGAIVGPQAGIGIGRGMTTHAPAGTMELGSSGGRQGITAYHVSPHSFDQFDVTKAGSGIGAGTEGRGVYLTTSPRLIDEYAKDMMAANHKPNKYTVAFDPSQHKFLDWDAIERDVPAFAETLKTEEGRRAAIQAGYVGAKVANTGAGYEGTHNYTIFDPSILRITNREPIPGPQMSADRSVVSLNRNGTLSNFSDAPSRVDQRPFSADYPIPAGEIGSPLTKDIDGRNLSARFVAGRRTVGGQDQGLTPREIHEVTKAITGRPAEFGSANEFKSSLGFYDIPGNRVKLHPDLASSPNDTARVLAHETAHAIDSRAAPLDAWGTASDGSRGLMRGALDPRISPLSEYEAYKLFHEMSTGKTAEPGVNNWVIPEKTGYSGAAVPMELSAEAIRAYLTNPNYIKTTAPRIARQIRHVVNNDPELSKTIQFNSETGGPQALNIMKLTADRHEISKGITAYHGSPHDFDRFDMSKIGTGEGAQAYGHGLYFSENPKVARAYEGMLAGNGYDPAVIARDALVDAGGDPSKALVKLERETPPKMGLPEFDILTDNYGIAKDHIKAHMSGQPLPLPDKGRMYEVRINADPEHFLDWDKPLSQQSDAIRDALKTAGLVPYANYLRTGERVPLAASTLKGAQSMQKTMGGTYRPDWDITPEKLTSIGVSKEDRSRLMREAGIPGIRYLDQGSRGAGEGSRNYVVFDDSKIEIIRKYMAAGMSLGAAIAAAQSQDANAKGLMP